MLNLSNQRAYVFQTIFNIFTFKITPQEEENQNLYYNINRDITRIDHNIYLYLNRSSSAYHVIE